jgi:Na+-transporting NADH:ubiquinone oxidoreductase subunit NqrC
MLSKWAIITIFTTILVVSVTATILILVLKKRIADEKIEDESYLKQKQDVLAYAIESKLKDNDNIVQVAASKLLSQTIDINDVTKKSNKLLQDQMINQQQTIQQLKDMYKTELQKIKNKDEEIENVLLPDKYLDYELQKDNLSRILDTTKPSELVSLLKNHFEQ